MLSSLWRPPYAPEKVDQSNTILLASPFLYFRPDIVPESTTGPLKLPTRICPPEAGLATFKDTWSLQASAVFFGEKIDIFDFLTSRNSFFAFGVLFQPGFPGLAGGNILAAEAEPT